MTTLTDPIPEFKLGADRYARREPGAARESEIHSLDPETQKVVETFEALYAELSYAAATPAPATDPDDDLQIDLPDEAKPTAPAPRAVEARAPPQSARQLLQSTAAPARAQSGVGEVDNALNIDDAFAMLRAAESKGRASVERDAVCAEEAENSTRGLTSAQPRTPKGKSQYPYDVTTPPDWTGKARALWSKVAGAAAIALMVGTGMGYMAGRTPEPVASQTKIPVTPQGAARLQIDYELGQK